MFVCKQSIIAFSHCFFFPVLNSHNFKFFIRSYLEYILIVDLPKVNIPFQKHTTSYGQAFRIVCKVVSSRYPILEVFWEEFDNGITTRIDDKTSGIEGVTIPNPSLTIKKPMVNSTYTCKARNAMGNGSSAEFHLIVKGGNFKLILI